MKISLARSFSLIRIFPFDPNYLNTSDELSKMFGKCLLVDASKVV